MCGWYIAPFPHPSHTRTHTVRWQITYGSALDVATGKVLELTLDAYFPPANDTRKARPVAVLVHGKKYLSLSLRL